MIRLMPEFGGERTPEDEPGYENTVELTAYLFHYFSMALKNPQDILILKDEETEKFRVYRVDGEDIPANIDAIAIYDVLTKHEYLVFDNIPAIIGHPKDHNYISATPELLQDLKSNVESLAIEHRTKGMEE